MNFGPENIVTIAIALIAASPAWFKVYKEWKSKSMSEDTDYQNKLIKLTNIVSQLLTLICTYDLLLQRVFIQHPSVNSDLKASWLEANKKLNTLRTDLDDV